ncbi:MAG: DnaJ domain-containing protein [Spirochaetes bacterium]|nr:DnaJ domain-containing protein [Spirochaetota bacterium]
MDIAFKDYYKILDIPCTADSTTIKTAFRKKAKETHPDSTKENNYAQFVLIREAYDILTNPSQRAHYDTVWKKYHAKTSPEIASIFEDFGPPDDRYVQEWEYFVLHPDDYLSRFESTIALIKATFKSIVISLCIPLLVMAGILITVTIALLILFVFSIAIASYSSLVAGIIITALMIKRLIEIIAVLFAQYVKKGAAWMNAQLKGIPMKVGKMVFYGTFTAAFLLLLGYAIAVIASIKMFTSYSYSKIIVLSIGIIAVVVVSLSVYFMFSVFVMALSQYPKIRYTKVKAKKENLLESKLLLH